MGKPSMEKTRVQRDANCQIKTATGARQSKCDSEKFSDLSMCFEEDFKMGLGNGKGKASDEIKTHRKTGRKGKGKGKGAQAIEDDADENPPPPADP
eukprot:11546142-Karenia_brevis.AAC.1